MLTYSLWCSIEEACGNIVVNRNVHEDKIKKKKYKKLLCCIILERVYSIIYIKVPTAGFKLVNLSFSYMRIVLQAETLGLIVGQRADLSPLKINTMLPSGSCHQLHSLKPRPDPGCVPVSPPWAPYGHSISCHHAWCHRHLTLISTGDYCHLSTCTTVLQTQMPLSALKSQWK